MVSCCNGLPGSSSGLSLGSLSVDFWCGPGPAELREVVASTSSSPFCLLSLFLG